MNFAALDSNDAPRRHSRIAIGIGVSLALHALLLSAWRVNLAHHAADTREPSRAIAVWLRPAPPPPMPASDSHKEQADRRAEAPATPRARKHPPAIIAMPAHPGQPSEREPVTVEQDSAPTPAAPRFDPDAARKFARRIADDPDPAKVGTAVGQFPEKPLATETRAARAIASAKRRDCKDGLPGGLLAPLYLMLDKKDSGCKW